VHLLKKIEELRSYTVSSGEYYSSLYLDKEEVIDTIKDAMLEKTTPDEVGWWWNMEHEAFVFVFEEDGKFKYGIYTFIDGQGSGYFEFNTIDSKGKWIKEILLSEGEQ